VLLVLLVSLDLDAILPFSSLVFSAWHVLTVHFSLVTDVIENGISWRKVIEWLALASGSFLGFFTARSLLGL
jgi:hypothetical protein